MAPGGKGTTAQDVKPAASWSLFKPITWQPTRKGKVAHEGQDMQMYFHPELKKWVERGREHEAVQDTCSAPPPTSLAPLSSGPSGTQRAGSRSRRGVADRYALQSNLSVSMDTDSISRASSSALLPPLLTSITPPASSNNFFLPPAPASSDGTPAVSHAASSMELSAPQPRSFFIPAPCPAGATPQQPSTQDTPASEPEHCYPSAAEQAGPVAAPEVQALPAAPLSEPTEVPPAPAQYHQEAASIMDLGIHGMPSSEVVATKELSSAASDAGSELGSKSLHNGQRFSMPRPDALAHWGMTGCWPSAPSSVCDSISSRDQDPLGHELDAFDAAMHPRRAGKLDGPLPWELPGQLRYSEEFVSICTAWQRRNPGRLYNPKMLLPPGCPLGSKGQAAADPDVDGGQRCAADVVAYLQQVVASLKARQDVPDSQIKHAVTLLTKLVGDKAPSTEAVAQDTPTKGAAIVYDSQKLQTPQRSSAVPTHVLESSPEMDAVVAKPVSSRIAVTKPAAAPGLTAQQMLRLKMELQEDYEQKLAVRSAEIEARFEVRLCEMRRELQEEYERRLAERDAELQAQRQRCEELQDDLDNLLLCLGQESRKVTDLCQAMADAGLDGSTITMSIEEEYALMDLPVSAA